MQTIKAKYNGEVFVPLEPVKAKNIKEAMVIIVEEGTSGEIEYSPKEKEKVWDKIKQTIAEKYPDLPNMTRAQANREFEQLSDKVAKSMEFKDWREMERFMKGDNYGLTGH